jgi:hypothetical protein
MQRTRFPPELSDTFKRVCVWIMQVFFNIISRAHE